MAYLTNLKSKIKTTSPKVRREVLNGREHLVVPVRMMVSGVLNGSKGPLYYPPEEIGRDVESWNGMPITVYHPSRGGQNVSARHPEIINSQGIGHVYNAHNRKGPLDAEAWIDIAKANQVDPRILKSIEAKQSIELSTGLFTTNEPAPDGATYNSKPYVEIARDYRPDHLAFLPDQVGACSIKDGCGVLVNEEILTPTDNGWVTIRGGNHIFIDKGGKVTKGPSALKGSGSSKTDTEDHVGVGGATYKNKEDRDSDNAYFKKESAKADKEVNKAKADLDAAVKKQDEHKATVKDLTDKLDAHDKKIADIKQKIDSKHESAMQRIKQKAESRKAALRAKLNEVMNNTESVVNGGLGSGSSPILIPIGTDLKHETHADKPPITLDTLAKAFNDSGFVTTTDPDNRGVIVSQNAKTVITTLLNKGWVSDSYQLAKGVRTESLSKGSNRITLTEEGSRTIAYATRGHVTNSKPTITTEKGSNMPMSAEDRSKLITGLTTNCKCAVANTYDESDVEYLEALDDTKLKKLATNRIRMIELEGVDSALRTSLEVPKTITANAMPDFIKKKMAAKKAPPTDEEEEDEGELPVKNEEGKKAIVGNTIKPMTEKEYLDNAPPSVRRAIQNAQRIEAKERTDLISKLTANIEDDVKLDRITKLYEGMEIADLQDLADAIIAPALNQQRPIRQSNYMGAGAPIGNRSTMVANAAKAKQDTIAAMTAPILNYKEISESNVYKNK